METDFDSTEGSESDSLEFNFDAQVIDSPASEPSSAAPQSKQNPAWSAALEKIPAEFRPQLTPIFQEWDTSVANRFKKVREEAVTPYQGFQRFVDDKVSPEQVQAAYELFQELNNNPLGVYERMGPMLRELGLLEAQEAEEDAEEEAPEYSDPRVDELARQQQEFIQGLQQAQMERAQQEVIARMDAKIQDEFSAIESKTGKMPEWLRLEIIDRASMMTDRENRDVSLLEAFGEVQQLRTHMTTGRPGQKAPRIVPSGGGYPAPAANPEVLKTQEGRALAMKEIIDRYK